ncbi:MAG: beta-lactamase family protein [Kangiellaceae bacterium]|nr:beta-lactamase family protein [Kangiellaceae bacterium]
MKSFFKQLLITSTLLITACGGGSDSSEQNSNPPTSNAPTTIQQAIDQATSRGVDAVWVYVVNQDGTGQAHVSGQQTRQPQEPAQVNSLFKIASISKLYIAAATAKLAAQGTLSLDDTLAFWLPEYSNRIANADSISLRQMVQHRSGIPDFDSQQGFSWELSHTNIDTVLAYALDLPADFSPNARYEYSNTNYLLIGKILDKALGYSHHDYIQANIVATLGLADTYSLLSTIDQSRLAHGYWNNVDRATQDYVIPGGSMIATVEDTARFVHQLNAGDLLSASEKAQYVYFYNHSGWVPGYQSIANYHSDIGKTVVQFVNTTGNNSEAIATQTYENILRVLRN